MKKIVGIIVCVLGIFCLSSCRSTSQSCGLADSSTSINQPIEQTNVL